MDGRIWIALAAAAATLAGPTARAQADEDLVRRVQTLLIAAGYEPGPNDGLAGDGTAAAIRAYETDWELPITGAVTEALAERLETREPTLIPVSNVDGCSVWISEARPQVVATWSGTCEAGLTVGDGELVVEWARAGGRIRYAYAGGRDGGLAEGVGVATYPNGERYEGGWAGGAFHGDGVYRFAHGGAWEGRFERGRRAGPGAYVAADGERFEGAVDGGCVRSGDALAFAIPDDAGCDN